MTEPEIAQQSTQAKSRSWSRRVLMLYQNGWWPAFSVGLVCCAVLLLATGAGPAIAESVVLAALSASLFSLTSGPFLDRWRTSATRPSYLIHSLAFGLLLLLWTILTLASLLLLVIFIGDRSISPWSELLPALDRVINGLGLSGLGLAWLAGYLCCLVGRARLRKVATEPYEGATRWRKIVGAALLIPYALIVGKAGSVVWTGARLDADFRKVYGQDISEALRRKSSTQHAGRAVTEANLPPTFRTQQVVADNLAGKPLKSQDLKSWLGIWCQEARLLWKQPRFWTDPQLIALAKLAVTESIIERSGLPIGEQAEAAVRSEVVLIEHGGVSSTQTQRLYAMELPAADWANLVKLGLQRDDLLHAAGLSEDDVREEFVVEGARVMGQRDYDMDGNLQLDFFQRCAQRAALNARWHDFQARQTPSKAGPPLSWKEFQKRYASSLAFDLQASEEDSTQATFAEDLARQNLAYDIVMMELKSLEAEHAPLPKSWSEFRPEVRAVGAAYSDWIKLSPGPNGTVRLRRSEPRSGMSLTHTFGKARTSS